MAKAKANTQPEELTVEGLMALGFDEATAQAMVQTSDEGGGLPAPLMKFNYDKEDVLSELGIKKGTFISGYKIDRQKLEVKEEGIDLGDALEVVLVKSVYQNSAYDIKTNQTSVASNIFDSPFVSKQSVDLKTGIKITELKKTNDKIKFNNIVAMLVNTKDGWKPYMFYLRGTAYFKWNEQLDKLGISRDNSVLQYTFNIKAKKVATTQQPAWIMEIADAKVRTTADLVTLKDEIAPLLKATTKWIDTVNSRAANTALPTADSGARHDYEAPVTDIDEDEIPF